ncbi:small multi-drug export protein [Candidatus Peregrinibacteria bacterium]|jgi:uncharacterized membrane protein|nr:small multi-drug export protein [Candidatus Peregrinibacteria bacterium]MBT4148113.1 small multi-drug export protein [Candidatus Peregrinibacteria bacterium]MBT4366361.1 small multi-drug export protein [Candidatus Peregrinibacteria bacterium]MBT4456433.1 small multi-drug export protein [Candidatus Peregrinibacteria bacterium]
MLENLTTPEIATFFTSMLPGLELRLGIPLGIGFGLSPPQAFIIGTLGNLIPAFFILKLLDPIANLLRKHSKLMDRFFTFLFDKTRNKHSKKFAKYGKAFIIIFVSIPLPGSGAWSGSLLAYLFGVKYWQAILLISLGVIIAGILVTAGFGSIHAIFTYLVA